LKTNNTAVAALCGFLILIAIVVPGRLKAQASAGPIAPSPSYVPPARPAATPKPRPVIQPRTTLNGAWNFNQDQSDDPRAKIRSLGSANTNNNCNGYPGGGYPGGGYPGGGYPGGGYPGGGYPGGGYPRGGGPCGGGRGNQGVNEQNEDRLLDLTRPANSLTFALKNPEVDVTDEQFHRLVFFTDGRQLQKPKDNTYQEIAAHWDGDRLVSDEKSPLGGKMSRSFELSQDGKQAFETIDIDRGKSGGSLYIRYVYDITDSQTGQASRDTDPNRPVLKRHDDGSSDSSAQGTQTNQAPDPDQPVLKRNDDSSGSNSTSGGTSNSNTNASSPQSAPASPQPNSDQPVLRRRDDNSNSSSQ
jgi:hypothetical protein